MRCVGHVAPMGEMRNTYKIKMDLNKMGSEDVEWIHLAQHRSIGGFCGLYSMELVMQS